MSRTLGLLLAVAALAPGCGRAQSSTPAPAADTTAAAPQAPAAAEGDTAPVGHYDCYTYGYGGALTSSSLTGISILPGNRMKIVGDTVSLEVDGTRLVLKDGTFAGAVAHVEDDHGKPKIVFVRKENEPAGHEIDMSDTYCYRE